MRTVIAVLILAAAGCTSLTMPATTTSRPGPTTPTTVTAATPGRCHIAGNLPDPGCTPGVANPAVSQANIGVTICKTGWTATVRPPAAYTDRLKLQQIAAYRLTARPAQLEEDHRIPLEAGGNPTDPRNLWPEPRHSIDTTGHAAEDKDLIENRVHSLICSGRLTLAQGQAVFAGDWWTWAATHP